MANYGIRIDIQKLKNTFLRKFTGKTSTKTCLCIPIEDNPMIFLGEKGCYLNLIARETERSQYGDTHYVVGNIPNDVYEKLTEEERKAFPIFGNMHPIIPKQQQEAKAVESTSPETERDNDLPF